jgi:hypothetical protein
LKFYPGIIPNPDTQLIVLYSKPGTYITLRAATGEAVILDSPAVGHKHDSILEVETCIASYTAKSGVFVQYVG